MTKQWFFETRFKDFCKEKGLEPHLNDIGNRLVLICPKTPEVPLQKEIEMGLDVLVPKEVEVKIALGLAEKTQAKLMSFLARNGIAPLIRTNSPVGEMTLPNVSVMINTEREGELILIVLHADQKSSSTVWDKAGEILGEDPFTKVWSIVVGTELVRNSEGFKMEETVEGDEEFQQGTPAVKAPPVVAHQSTINGKPVDSIHDELPELSMADIDILLNTGAL